MSCTKLARSLIDASANIRMCHIHVTSPQFTGLHAFYLAVYEALDAWFDRVAERARASGEKMENFTVSVVVPKGNCIERCKEVLNDVLDLAVITREDEDTTTQAMIDELVEYLEKHLWQLESMS